MNKLVPLLALALLTQATGCKTKDPAPPQPPPSPLSQLPPETQTGQRTFGCLVNGQAWTPAGSPLGGPLLSAAYSNDRLGVSANRVIPVNNISSFQRIGFSFEGIQNVGTYALTDSLTKVGSYEDFENSCKTYTSKAQVGTLVITRLDPIARIVSGRFSFTLEKAGCGRVVVTDGRFDCPF
ncbi:hypothetical protein GCM10022409_15140 [Hymenobacter glaciei]|uniref:Lipoprotein n=1 Tax=Hymenobacter glaciei TaxID=877209 RepID=A0ABP7TVY6_9BACT